MSSIKDMTFNELKEKIESFTEEIEGCSPGTGDHNTLSEKLALAKKELKLRKQKLHDQIIRDITDMDTMSKEESNYSSYLTFLSDAEMGTEGYEEVLFDDFTEEDLERLWKESH